jgi:hypothetical protein
MLLFSNEVPTVRIAEFRMTFRRNITFRKRHLVFVLRRKGVGGTAYSVGTVSRSCPLIEASYI